MQGFGGGNLMERDHLGDPGVDWRIIIRWIFRKQDVGYGLGRAGSGQGQVADTCECGNEPSGSIKCEDILDYLKTGQVLTKDQSVSLHIQPKYETSALNFTVFWELKNIIYLKMGQDHQIRWYLSSKRHVVTCKKTVLFLTLRKSPLPLSQETWALPVLSNSGF